MSYDTISPRNAQDHALLERYGEITGDPIKPSEYPALHAQWREVARGVIDKHEARTKCFRCGEGIPEPGAHLVRYTVASSSRRGRAAMAADYCDDCAALVPALHSR